MRPLAPVLALLMLAAPAPAGVYSPHEPTPFTIRPDGTAEPLSFGTKQNPGQCLVLLTTRMNELNPNPALVNTDREKVLARIAAAGPSRNPKDLAALAADLLRVGRADDALNRLAPLRRDPDAGFAAAMNLAHVHAVRGEWREAMPVHEDAAFGRMPDDLPGTTPEQRAWLPKVEKTYYSRWLAIHAARATDRPSPTTEDVLPLFPGVRFVNDAGRYEPGKLASASREKLPPDAVAVTQQLLLWAPWDTSLYWLLGELYAAEGKLREAQTIFDQCADARQYSNRTLFVEHRAAVRDAIARLPSEKSADEVALPDLPTPPDDDKKGADLLPPLSRIVPVAAVFGVIVLALLVLQMRSMARWYRNGCGPTG